MVDIIRAYLLHVSRNPSPKLMVFGLFFSIWFPMRATNALMVSVRTAYHLGPPRRAVIHRLKTLLYTVVLISAIALTLVLMTVGDRLLGYDGCMNFFSGPTDKAFSATINLYNCHYSSTHILGTTGGTTDDLKESDRKSVV